MKMDIISRTNKENTSGMRPLIYSCSGSSSAAQMANYMALQIDRNEIADMSCIAGVGGGVEKLVKTALSGRKIIVIDGCPLACSKACLSQHGLVPDLQIELSAYGVSKRNHVDFDKQQAEELLEIVKEQIDTEVCETYQAESTGPS